MKTKNKGFTLLEVIMAIMLFAILLEGMGHFFSTIYKEFTEFDTKIILNNEATAVEDFMRDYIRMADGITIVTTSDEPIVPNQTVTRSQEILEEIEIARRVQTTVSGGSSKETIERCKIQVEPNYASDQGSYKLNYVAEGNKRLISDYIENIKVSTTSGSNLVEIECTIAKKVKTNDRLKVTVKFTESLAYKQRASEVVVN